MNDPRPQTAQGGRTGWSIAASAGRPYGGDRNGPIVVNAKEAGSC